MLLFYPCARCQCSFHAIFPIAIWNVGWFIWVMERSSREIDLLAVAGKCASLKCCFRCPHLWVALNIILPLQLDRSNAYKISGAQMDLNMHLYNGQVAQGEMAGCICSVLHRKLTPGWWQEYPKTLSFAFSCQTPVPSCNEAMQICSFLNTKGNPYYKSGCHAYD